MRCETCLQTVVICSEKDSSSSISRPSSLTFITLVNKLPLQVISGLLFILVESRFPFTVRTLVFFSLSGSLLANAQLKTSDTDVVSYRFHNKHHFLTLETNYSLTIVACDLTKLIFKSEFKVLQRGTKRVPQSCFPKNIFKV